MQATWQAYPDAATAATACARKIVERLEDALACRPFATLAVSGGSTPRLLFDALAASSLDWTDIHLFWTDERAVPPGNPQSNYRLAKDHLIDPVHVPSTNIHRICGEHPPKLAARRYTEHVRGFFNLAAGEMPRFDVIHQGMGADAHTASLFPGEPLLNDREGIAAAVLSEKVPQKRVTLLPGVLLAARQTVFLVAGADKASPVRAVLDEPYSPTRYPAQLSSRYVVWFLDQAAASLLA